MKQFNLMMVFVAAFMVYGCSTISAVTSVAGAVVSVGATAVSTAASVGGSVVSGTVDVLAP